MVFFEPRRRRGAEQGLSGGFLGVFLIWGQIEQFPVTWVFEKVIQIVEHEFLVRERRAPVA